jgi:hypothetical protein
MTIKHGDMVKRIGSWEFKFTVNSGVNYLRNM